MKFLGALLGMVLLFGGLIGLILGKLPKIRGRKIPLAFTLIGLLLIMFVDIGPSNVPSVAPSSQPSQSATQQAESNIDKATTEALQKYLNENFGNPKTSWYDSIQKIEVRYDRGINKSNERSLEVWTLYYPDDEGKQAAKQLLAPFLGFFNDSTKDYPKLARITIYGQNDHPIYSGIGGVDFPTK